LRRCKTTVSRRPIARSINPTININRIGEPVFGKELDCALLLAPPSELVDVPVSGTTLKSVVEVDVSLADVVPGVVVLGSVVVVSVVLGADVSVGAVLEVGGVVLVVDVGGGVTAPPGTV
jgi:hypothetical protein